MAILGIVLNFLYFALQIYNWIFVAYILLSWFPIPRDNIIVKFLVGICEPFTTGYLKFCRRFGSGCSTFQSSMFLSFCICFSSGSRNWHVYLEYKCLLRKTAD